MLVLLLFLALKYLPTHASATQDELMDGDGVVCREEIG